MGDKAGARVVELQRARLIAAAGEVARERGVKAVTVTEVVRRARISRRSFYDIFLDGEECMLAALEDALAQARQRVLCSQKAIHGGWRAQMREGLAALLGFFDESPQAAHLLVVESLHAGPKAMRLRDEVLRELAGRIERDALRDRRASGSGDALVGEALVGGALAILHRRLLHDTQRPNGRRGRGRGPTPPVGRLIELTGPLMSMMVLCRLGPAAARRELERPPVARALSDDVPAAASDLLGVRGIRMTDRTILVLSAIGALSSSGAPPSNRQVALAAGVNDQGQISKLLARLRRHRLIESSSGEVRLGAANAWRLTARGEAVVRSLPQQA